MGGLESADVEFIDENGGGPGVRLRRPAATYWLRRQLLNEPNFIEIAQLRPGRSFRAMDDAVNWDPETAESLNASFQVQAE